MRERPVRVQQRRTKGWRMPADTRSVARPSKYGNPYRVVPCGGVGNGYAVVDAGGVRVSAPGLSHVAARLAAVLLHRVWLDATPEGRAIADAAKADLRGWNLACWCPLDQPCHADNLLATANEETADG